MVSPLGAAARGLAGSWPACSLGLSNPSPLRRLPSRRTTRRRLGCSKANAQRYAVAGSAAVTAAHIGTFESWPGFRRKCLAQLMEKAGKTSTQEVAVYLVGGWPPLCDQPAPMQRRVRPHTAQHMH